MAIHELEGTLDEVRVSLVEEYLAGRDDRDVLPERTAVLGNNGLILLGPHAPDGWCWCQPAMVLCAASGGSHAHPTHQDRSH